MATKALLNLALVLGQFYILFPRSTLASIDHNDVSVKIFTGLALRIEDGHFYIADTPGAIPAHDVGMHAAVGDMLTGVDDIPLTMQAVSNILERDHAYAVLPLIEGGLYSPHNRTFTVRGFVKIQTFFPSILNVRPTSPSRAAGLEKAHKDELKQRRLAEDEHKRRDALERQTLKKDTVYEKLAEQQAAEQAAEVAGARKDEAVEKLADKKEEEKLKKKTMQDQAAYDEQVTKGEQVDKREVEQTEKARIRQKAKLKEEKEKNLKRLEKPTHDYFNIIFKKEGPMGIWFSPNVYPPTVDVQQGNRGALRLSAGDCLFSFNDEALPPEGKMSEMIEKIIKSKFPKKLRFARKRNSPGEISAEFKNAAFLEIRWPRIMSGKYKVIKGDFGGNFSCILRNLSVADPFDACDTLKAKAPIENGSLMLAMRGVCTFSKKAYFGQKLGAASVIMINTDSKLSIMPAGNRKTNDLHVSMAMIDLYEGIALKHAVKMISRSPKRIAGKYILLDDMGAEIGRQDCLPPAEDITSVEVSPTGNADADEDETLWSIDFDNTKDTVYGKLIVWDGTKTRAFKIQMAKFGGKHFSTSPFILTMATPLEACKGLKTMIKNSVVIIARGGCDFLDKSKLAQGSGGIGLVILNTEDSLFPAPADPRQAIKVTIPVATIASSAGEILKQLTNNGKKAIIGRVIVPARSL